MMFKVNLFWCVAVISAGFSFQRTATLALVQNGRNYRLSEQTGVTEERKRRTMAFETPVVTSSFSPSSKSSLMLADTNQAESDADPDLFEYFDPLLSPHAYPSGISPEKKPAVKSNDEIEQQVQGSSQQKEDRGSKGSFGIRLPIREQNDEEKSQQKEGPGSKGEFGFDFSTPEQKVEEKSSSSTRKDVGFKIRPNPTTSIPTTEETDDEKEVNLFEYFDPLRSPHEYPDGIKPTSPVTAPSALEVVGDDKESSGSSGATNSNSNGKKKKIGVLLMDHGSKKEKSNARLQRMAELYQLTLGTDEDEEDDTTPTMIVRAAHMEIAEPSIPQQLKVLKDLGVDEIICHPFFLSPGRHVKEDIPEIIGGAIEDLWGENSGATPIPVVTTAPVGSNTQLMLGAIHSLVRENSQYLKTTIQNES